MEPDGIPRQICRLEGEILLFLSDKRLCCRRQQNVRKQMDRDELKIFVKQKKPLFLTITGAALVMFLVLCIFFP